MENMTSGPDAPGPGTYVQTQLIDNITKKTWGKNGVVGSTERRFVPLSGSNPAALPGPGQYLHPGTMAEKSPQASDLKRSSSMFCSKTNRL